MNYNLSQDEIAKIIKENKTLKRRLDRMSKEMTNLVSLHDQALKLREFSEKEKNKQYEFNVMLLENAPDIIFILDTEMRFRLGTKEFSRFLGGKDIALLSGQPFEEFFCPVMPEEWIEATRRKFDEAVNERKQIQFNDQVMVNGCRKVFSVSIAPAIESGGRVTGVICLMHDSTELVEMKEAAEAATQAKSSFLASMSHEIRTPMNAIKGFSDLMTRTPLTNQQKVYTDNIINATSSLLMIINDILDFSKIEANRYEIVKADYDMASELSELCSLMQPKTDEKGIYFIADIDPDIPTVFFGDHLRIRQILINIINNAIKFTHEGGILFSVSGKKNNDEEWLISYSVKDTGQGISEEELPKIFQAFEQADFYKNRNISGTGLGLAISKSLAELMNGSISVASEYGKGSTFTVAIPQALISGQPLARVEQPEENRVVLYYDNYEVARLTGKSLEKLGVDYRVVSANQSLSDAVKGYKPTHMIIDNDIQLAREITEGYPDIYVGCLQSVSGLGKDVPENVHILFRPLLVFGLAAFINGKDSLHKSGKSNAGKLGSMNFKGARVLIVDDNEVNLIVASEIIKTYDISPDTASSGEEALEAVKNGNYRLVFMDHMMPGMDGVETTAEIRKLNNIVQPVIIALTANAMLGMEEVYRENGLDGYITKPIDVDSLNEVLEKWLSDNRS